MSTMTKAEREELRRIVKQRFKVLRNEVESRERELTAEVDHEIVARHRHRDDARKQVTRAVTTIVRDAADKIEAEMEEHRDVTGVGTFLGLDRRCGIHWEPDERAILRRAAVSDLDAKVKAAKLRLDREEVDLLQALAIGVLESDEARAFLERIPTVGELVPAARLDALEAALGDGAEP